MLGTIIFALLMYFGSPLLVVWLIGLMFAELAAYYGSWLFPAVFGLILGIALKITGTGDPELPFSTLPQTIAGSHIAGIETPTFLIVVGLLCLVGVPLYRTFKRLKSA